MDVVSTCALPVASLVWQPRPSAWVLTVVCKATYVLRPGECTLAPVQEHPSDDDRYWGDDPARSLRSPRDLVPVKPGADVILVGSAFAPDRRPARTVEAHLAVGDIAKTIEAVADRTVRPDGSVREGQPFTQMPLVYERTGGGPGTTNPVGVRREVRDSEGGMVLPNLQRPGASLQNAFEPVGFGPIAPSWPERRDRLGAASATWSYRDLGQRPLPEGMDLAFFNAAPRDQQLRAFGERLRIALNNLHPDYPQLMTSLPTLPPRAILEGRREGSAVVTLRADTLWIDTDRGLCTLTFRGTVPIQSADERGRVIVSMEGDRLPGEITTSPRVVDAPAGVIWSPHSPPRTLRNPLAATLDPPAMIPGAALPFGPPPQVFTGGQVVISPRVAEEPSGAARPPRRYEMTADIPLSARQAPHAALPFGPSSPSPAPPEVILQPPQAAPDLLPWAPSAPALRAIEPSILSAYSAPASASPWSESAQPAEASPISAPSFLARAPASTVSVLAASNAATAPRVGPTSTRRSMEPEPAPPTQAEVREAIDLVWFDVDSVPRIRRKTRWQPLLDALERTPLDADFEDPAFAKDPLLVEERREIFEILARGEPTLADGLHEALVQCLRQDGKFVPTLAFVAGEIELPFDEIAVLRTTLSTVAPLAGPDEALKNALEAARDFLATPGLMSAPAVAEGLTKRIEDAFAQGKRVVVAGYLDAQRERALVEHRQYQRRSVFGSKHLRALLDLGETELSDAGSSLAPRASATAKVPGRVPLYLPEPVAELLPLYARFRGRIVVEVRLPVDRYETHSVALRALALARTTAPPKR